jgi:hypothetical protein
MLKKVSNITWHGANELCMMYHLKKKIMLVVSDTLNVHNPT